MKKLYFLALGLTTLSLSAQSIGSAKKVETYTGDVQSILHKKTASDIFNQDSNGKNGYGVADFTAFGSGIYITDDFELESNSKISKISTYGFTTVQPYTQLNSVITGVSFMIFEDIGGTPLTNPDDPYKEFTLQKGDPGLIVQASGQMYELSLDLTAANIDLKLDGNKRYWLSVTPIVNTTNANLRYAWFKATDNKYDGQVQLSDPGDLFQQGYTTWTPLDDFFPADALWGDFGLAFTITGENDLGVTESHSTFKALVYNDKASDVLNIVLSDGNQLNNVEIYDASGKKVITSKNSKSISTSTLSHGTYFIILNTKNGIEKTKFIK